MNGLIQQEKTLGRMICRTRRAVIKFAAIVTVILIVLELVMSIGANSSDRAFAYGMTVEGILFIVLLYAILKIQVHIKCNKRRIVKNSSEYLNIDNQKDYADELYDSLKNEVLIANSEIVLTKRFIIGTLYTDAPGGDSIVAIKRDMTDESICAIGKVGRLRGKHSNRGRLNIRLTDGKIVSLNIGDEGMARYNMSQLEQYINIHEE